jgi:acetyltransferase-like isoleucine patch superfamily enzyme
MTNQLRRHLKYNFVNRVINLKNKFILGSVGKNVYFDRNVQFLRYKKNINIGDNVIFKSGAKIASCNQNAFIEIGNNTTIGYNTFIFSSKSIKIGDNCMISSFVYLVDSAHGTKKGELMNSQLENSNDIIIGDDVWIGQGSTILPGIKIDDGAVVGAGSVVTESIKKDEIFAGNPAKKIRDRI